MPYKDPNSSEAKESRKKSYKKWYDKQSDEYRRKRNANQRTYLHRINGPDFRKKHNKRAKQLSLKYRLEVLIHYGGNPPKCACCGETRYEFLTIDHINNDGAKDRKKFVNNYAFYRWLIKNNFPEGYRILCYNCNCSLGHYGYCPHKTTGTP